MINRTKTLTLAGAALFAMMGAAAAQSTYSGKPGYIEPNGMPGAGQREVVVQPPGGELFTGNVNPMSMEAKYRSCARLYASFDPQTGTFVGEDGMRHLCQ